MEDVEILADPRFPTTDTRGAQVLLKQGLWGISIQHYSLPMFLNVFS
jgi:hypothetical protein